MNRPTHTRFLTALAGAASLLVAPAIVALPTAAAAQFGIGISVNFGPPPLPVYVQPPCPGPNFIWQPGYWAWDRDDGDYYWVPGAWVVAPRIGLLWTPAWWGYEGGAYGFHDGYWGRQVGWYGGINYGFGFGGNGYQGGYWNHNSFYYNRTVNNVSNVTNITNIYNAPVTQVTSSHSSFNGPGGVQVRPTPQQLASMNQPHIPPTAAQQQHIRAAMAQPQLRAGQNHGAPPIAAVSRPGQFRGPGVVAARSAGPGFRPMTPQARTEALRNPTPQPHNNGQGFQPSRPNAPGYGQPHNTTPAYQQGRPNGGANGQPRYNAQGYEQGRPNGGAYGQPHNGPAYQQPRPNGPAYGQPHNGPPPQPHAQPPHPQPPQPHAQPPQREGKQPPPN